MTLYVHAMFNSTYAVTLLARYHKLWYIQEVVRQAALTDHLVNNTDNSIVGPLAAELMQQTECIRQLAETLHCLFFRLRVVFTQLIPLNLVYTVYCPPLLSTSLRQQLLSVHAIWVQIPERLAIKVQI